MYFDKEAECGGDPGDPESVKALEEAKKQKVDRRVMMQTERANTARPPKKEKTGVKAMEDIADEIDREYFSTR